MIQYIIEYINDRIETLDIFQDIKGLCEIIEKEGQSYPAEYCDNGEYNRIEDFESVVYHRLTGKTTEERIESTVGCETNIRRTYPLRVVGIVKKTILEKKNDNNYIDDKLASNISNIIAKASIKNLAVALKAEDVEISTGGYNTNRYEIWNEEYKGVEMGIDFEYAYISVDYTVIVEGSKSCFHIFDCDTNITVE